MAYHLLYYYLALVISKLQSSNMAVKIDKNNVTQITQLASYYLCSAFARAKCP